MINAKYSCLEHVKLFNISCMYSLFKFSGLILNSNALPTEKKIYIYILNTLAGLNMFVSWMFGLEDQ